MAQAKKEIRDLNLKRNPGFQWDEMLYTLNYTRELLDLVELECKADINQLDKTMHQIELARTAVTELENMRFIEVKRRRLTEYDLAPEPPSEHAEPEAALEAAVAGAPAEESAKPPASVD